MSNRISHSVSEKPGRVAQTKSTTEKKYRKPEGRNRVGGKKSVVAKPKVGSLMFFESYTSRYKALKPQIENALKNHPELATELRKLHEASLKAATDERYADAIGLLNDKIEPLLKSASRLSPSTPETKAKKSETKSGGTSSVESKSPATVANKVDLVNQTLGEALKTTFEIGGEASLENSVDGSGSPATGTQFFNAVKITFPGTSAATRDSLLRDWSINMAMLQHFASKFTAGSPEHQALMNRTIGYLLKFANIPNVDDLGWQANPVQIQQLHGDYHRQGNSPLTRVANELTAKKLLVSPENCILVSDPRVLEEVRRNYALEGEGIRAEDWRDDDYDRVLRKALAKNPVFIDAGASFKELQNKHAPPTAEVARIMVNLKRRAFETVAARHGKPELKVNQLDNLGETQDQSSMTQAERFADNRRTAEERRVKDAIRKDYDLMLKSLDLVRIGGVLTVGEQYALTMFPANPKLSKTQPPDFQLTDYGKLRQMVNHSGFTPGPEQLLDHLVTLTTNVVELLGKLGVANLPKVEFPKNMKLELFPDVRGTFFNLNETAKKFTALAENDEETGAEPPPFVKVNVKALCKLIEGLQYGDHGKDVLARLTRRNLEPLWALSLNKIESLMAKAIKNRGSMREFLDATALIQEEVANLIAVAKPYSKADFSKGMTETTKMFPDEFLVKGISADFTLKNSASRCFNAVLTACEDVKEQAQGGSINEQGVKQIAKRGLEVLVQSDSYYEPSQYVLEHSREHRQTSLHTDSLAGASGTDAFKSKIVDLRKLQDQGKRAKFDTYLCEFHHNIAYGREKYAAEDVKTQVRMLLDEKVVADPFTVAIDTTIAKTDEKTISDFLAEFKTEIENGKLNVVIYRSAQKFDQLGGDTYNGGIMCVVSGKTANDAANPFKRALDGQGEVPSEQNFQGLTHLNLSAQEEINEYRAAIMENTRKLGDPTQFKDTAIPARMLLTDENKDKSILQIAVNEDEEAPFLDIKLPFLELNKEPSRTKLAEWNDWQYRTVVGQRVYGRIMNLFNDQTAAGGELISSTRASFGFQHSNLTLIAPVKMRFNPGLEDDASLKGFRDTFVGIDEMLMGFKSDIDKYNSTAKDDSKLPDRMFPFVVANSDLISYRVLAAHRKLASALRSAAAVDKDAARLGMIEEWCKVKGFCANPLGVRRLVEEMSDDFKKVHKTTIDGCMSEAEVAVKAIVSFCKLDEANVIAREGKDFAALGERLKRVDPSVLSLERRAEYDRLSKWSGYNSSDSEFANSKSRFEAAVEAWRANDPVTVLEMLEDMFAPDFFNIRGGEIDWLRTWAENNYVNRNRAVADELLAKVDELLAQGLDRDAGVFLDELDRMATKQKTKGTMPGLPLDLSDRIEQLRKRVKSVDAASRASEYLRLKGSERDKVRSKWLAPFLDDVPESILSASQRNKLKKEIRKHGIGQKKTGGSK